MATLSQIEEEDNEIYAYVVLGAICIGFLLLLTQLYYANYDLVQRLHIDIPFLDKHVFSSSIFFLPCWGTPIKSGMLCCFFLRSR